MITSYLKSSRITWKDCVLHSHQVTCQHVRRSCWMQYLPFRSIPPQEPPVAITNKRMSKQAASNIAFPLPLELHEFDHARMSDSEQNG